MKPLIEVLNSGADYLAKQGCDEARSLMQHLMAHVLKCNRTYLYTHFDRLLSEEELAPLRDLLKRKANGEPLQHLLGTTEFYRREFLTDSRALIPRPETEELVELTLKKAGDLQCPLRVLDMGTGSGIIGITMALELGERASETVLADISPSALSLALENSMRLGAKVSTIESNLFSSLAEKWGCIHSDNTDDNGRFDVIIANLHYIPDGENLQKEVRFDPSTALYGGEKGWEIIERFLDETPQFMTAQGFNAMEIGYDQNEIVARLLEERGYRDITFFKDMDGIPRFPFAARPDAATPENQRHENGQNPD